MSAKGGPLSSTGMMVGMLVALGAGCEDEAGAAGATAQPRGASSAPPAASAPARPAAAPVEKEELSAEAIYQKRCVVCHGKEGKGDGPGAKQLDPKPRSFQDPEWQQSVTDEHIEKVIVEGGPAVDLDPSMPANPDLKDQPKVVEGLVKKIRSFGEK